MRKKTKKFALISFGTFILLMAAEERGLLPVGINSLRSLVITSVIIGAAAILLLNSLKRARYLNSPLKKIDRMSGEDFEVWLMYWFENKGYRARLTDKTGDFGADLILKGRGEKVVVQAKRYKKSVGIEAVQQVIGAKGHYKADRCIVATNSRFTAAARTLAKDNGVELMDRDYFFKKRRR